MTAGVMADFDTAAEAERAVASLRGLGVPPADISVILQEPYVHSGREKDRDDVLAGATTGAVSGAILGGLAGWVLSLGSFDLFGVGGVAREYAPGATFAGAALGAALLGLLGAIAGLNFDANNAPRVEQGDVLVTVLGHTVPSERIEALMRENNALNVQRVDDLPERGVQPGGASYAPGSLPHGAPEDSGSSGGSQDRSASQGTPMVRPGQAVHTLDDEKLGEVGDASGDYFTVKRGLLHSDLYIPFEDVHDIRPDVVYVNAVAAEVDLMNWKEQPRQRSHRSEDRTRP